MTKRIAKRRLLYFVTEDWFFCSHWLPLAAAAREAGHEVFVVTRVREHGERIRKAGFRLIPMEMSRRGINPFLELLVILRLTAVYRKIRPGIVHHMGQKPMVYGSIAARMAGIPVVVNALMGLGFLFISENPKARVGRYLVMKLYKALLNRPESHVILENPDDLRLLIDKGILKTNHYSLIRGAGVDIRTFAVRPESGNVPLVVLASRLLWDKGVGEFVGAARILKKQGVNARFVLVGDRDSENPTAVSPEQLDEWQAEGVVEWWGYRSDISEVFGQSHIVCLPSYREGVPKVLLEAAACGRPIVTSDAPGCREIVSNGQNGFLVPLRDSAAVADALKKLIDFPDLRKSMGLKGRERVENNFTHCHINTATLGLYAELTN